MPIFPTLVFRRSPVDPAPVGPDLPDDVRHALPLRFEAVGESLVSGADVTAACSVVGRDVARDGAALGEALSGLRTTYELVLGEPPAFDAAEALSVAWSDATLEYLHDLSCEDPLTGLASLAARAHPPRRDLPRGRAHRRRGRRQPRAGHRRAVLPRAHRRPGPPASRGRCAWCR